MNIITCQRKNLFKKGVYLACFWTVLMSSHVPYVDASGQGGNIEIDEVKRPPKKVSSQGRRVCESESECGGCFTKVTAPGVNVETKAEKAGMKVKI